MFKVYKKEIEVAGKKISLETGKVASDRQRRCNNRNMWRDSRISNSSWSKKK